MQRYLPLNLRACADLPETAMLRQHQRKLCSPRSTRLAVARRNRIQLLHFALWLLKKGRNTQERILHFSSDQLNYSLHAKPPHHLAPVLCRAFATTMNDIRYLYTRNLSITHDGGS